MATKLVVPEDAVMVHEPHGFVQLSHVMAEDLDVVNAARVSFEEESSLDRGGYLNPPDEGLIRYLMKNRHGTPFEHTFFKFRVRAPIFVFREWHRHRIGVSVNEESARYVQLRPDFYLPDDEHCRKQVGKPGHYTYEPVMPVEAQGIRVSMNRSYQEAYDLYSLMMEEGVAKEIARTVLPVGIYSQMIWSCNARSLMAFLSLRNAPTAMREIKDYAQVMEGMFADCMPVTCQAFIENGRVAP